MFGWQALRGVTERLAYDKGKVRKPDRMRSTNTTHHHKLLGFSDTKGG